MDSSSARAGPSSGATPRHLKRLSLSSFPTSNSLAQSTNSTRAATPSSATSPSNGTAALSSSRGHAPRHLRLSMSGSSSSLAYNSAPMSAPATNQALSFDDPLEPPTLRGVSGLSRSNTTASISSRSPNLNGAHSNADGVPTQQSSLSRSRSMGHSRGLSSISYSSSPAVSLANSRPTSIEGPPPLVGLNISHVPAPGMVRRFSAERGEGLGLLPGSPSLASSTSLGGVSELAETESEVDSEAEKRRAHEERASVAAATQPPTLIEANADLLSFIAKKERKCLDLREELKRHEAELGQLKKRWESIVAKSVSNGAAQQRPISPTTRFSLSIPRSNNNRDSSPNGGDRSPGGSPGGLHTLDMSLLASTFDASPGDDYNEAVDLSAELSNAKAWMGSTMNGMLGKLADVVTTLEESFDGGQEGRLDVLAEEDEDEGNDKAPHAAPGHRRGAGEHQSIASASSVEDRRASRASSASFDSSSSYGFSSSGVVSPTPRSEAGQSDTSSMPSTSPTLTRSNLTGPPLSASARSRGAPSPATPASTSSNSSTPASASSSHSRSFSLGSFSSVTASSWSSIGKKLSAATNSDAARRRVPRPRF